MIKMKNRETRTSQHTRREEINEPMMNTEAAIPSNRRQDSWETQKRVQRERHQNGNDLLAWVVVIRGAAKWSRIWRRCVDGDGGEEEGELRKWGAWLRRHLLVYSDQKTTMDGERERGGGRGRGGRSSFEKDQKWWIRVVRDGQLGFLRSKTNRYAEREGARFKRIAQICIGIVLWEKETCVCVVVCLFVCFVFKTFAPFIIYSLCCNLGRTWDCVFVLPRKAYVRRWGWTWILMMDGWMHAWMHGCHPIPIHMLLLQIILFSASDPRRVKEACVESQSLPI